MAQDFYQLRLQGLHQTEYNECVMFYRGTNLTAADYFLNALDLVTNWQAEVQPFWLDMLPTSYQLLRVSAKKASVGGGGEYTTQIAMGAAPGTVTGGAASQQLCPVVRLIPPMGIKTAGKIFLPCIAESQVAANAPSAQWTINLASLMANAIAPAPTGAITWELCIFSRKNGTFSLVQAFDTSPTIGFQRRRQRAYL